MKNQAIADSFREIAGILELQGANPFRIRAYQNAATQLERTPRDIEKLTEKEIDYLPGIGPDLLKKIEEFLKTGKIKALEKLRKEVPNGLLEMLAIPGIGPKTVKLLAEKGKIKNVSQLKKAALSDALVRLPGIREKREQDILRGIGLLRPEKKIPIDEVLPIAEKLIQKIRKIKGVERAEIAGSLRRRKPEVKDIDILVASETPEVVIQKFVKFPEIKDVLAQGETKASVILKPSLIEVDLRVVHPDSFGAAWHYFTGSKAHNIHLRKIAQKKGWKINEYGIFRNSDGKKIAGETEEEFYKKLGLPWIPPEEREDSGEIERAMSEQ